MSKELPDHGGSSWAYLFHDAAHRKRLALPRLWPRERADDRDVPLLQAVAERGGNVLTYVILVVGLVVAFFVAGFFEGMIVRRCDDCGKEGPTKAVCWLYGGIPKKKRLGVVHVMCCAECLRKRIDSHFGFRYEEKA